MRRRVLVLPIAALLILLACLYKWNRRYDYSAVAEPERFCFARNFDFRLPQQSRRSTYVYVSLHGYLNRHRIFVVFYDGKAGAEKDPFLVRLRENYDQLKRRNVQVLGISTALPRENRPPDPGDMVRQENQPSKPFPFFLLSDRVNPSVKLSVHKMWGRYDPTRDKPLTGVFFVDRKGLVRCDGRKPVPLDDPDGVLDAILAE